MTHLEKALQALKDSSDVQLKKLYVKEKPPETKTEESELSAEDRELLEQLMKE